MTNLTVLPELFLRVLEVFDSPEQLIRAAADRMIKYDFTLQRKETFKDSRFLDGGYADNLLNLIPSMKLFPFEY